MKDQKPDFFEEDDWEDAEDLEELEKKTRRVQKARRGSKRLAEEALKKRVGTTRRWLEKQK